MSIVILAGTSKGTEPRRRNRQVLMHQINACIQDSDAHTLSFGGSRGNSHAADSCRSDLSASASTGSWLPVCNNAVGALDGVNREIGNNPHNRRIALQCR